MLNINSIKVASLIVLSSMLLSCDEEDKNKVVKTTESSYFVAMEAATDPKTEVLLPVDKLTEGEISPVNKGFVQAGFTSFLKANNKIITIGSRSSGEGIDAYSIIDGSLKKEDGVTLDMGIYAHATEGENIVFIGSPRSGYDNKKIYIANTKTMAVTSTKEVEFGNRKEYNTISFPVGMNIRDGKLFIAYHELSDDGEFATPHAEEAKVAVFNYPSLTFEKIISDARMPNIGRYYSFNNLDTDETGHIYACASSAVTCGFWPVPKANSGILRIKKGETDFDKDFYIDFEAISEGAKIVDFFYVANGKAVVRTVKEMEIKAYAWGVYSPKYDMPLIETGILDLDSKTFKVLPDVPKCNGTFSAPHMVEGNKIYLGVTAKELADIYVIDVNKGTAVKGAKISGNYAKGIFKLNE